jgi:phage-related protein
MATGRIPRKPLVLLHGKIKTPPFSRDARIEAGELMRSVQEGESLEMPHSRPMPSIGPRCHEIRVPDENTTWRIVYRIDPDAIPVAEVFAKKTNKTPKWIIDICKKRFRKYDGDKSEAEKKAKEPMTKTPKKGS